MHLDRFMGREVDSEESLAEEIKSVSGGQITSVVFLREGEMITSVYVHDRIQVHVKNNKVFDLDFG